MRVCKPAPKKKRIDFTHSFPGFEQIGLGRRGLARVADSAVFSRVEKLYPGYSIQPVMSSGEMRELHRGQGIRDCELIPVQEFACRKRDYARAMFKKHPPKRK